MTINDLEGSFSIFNNSLFVFNNSNIFRFSAAVCETIFSLQLKVMKSKFVGAALVIMLPFFASAQLKGLMNKVKNKVDQRMDNKVDKQIDKNLDEIEGKNDKEVADNGNTSTNTVTETK